MDACAEEAVAKEELTKEGVQPPTCNAKFLGATRETVTRTAPLEDLTGHYLMKEDADEVTS